MEGTGMIQQSTARSMVPQLNSRRSAPLGRRPSRRYSERAWVGWLDRGLHGDGGTRTVQTYSFIPCSRPGSWLWGSAVALSLQCHTLIAFVITPGIRRKQHSRQMAAVVTLHYWHVCCWVFTACRVCAQLVTSTIELTYDWQTGVPHACPLDGNHHCCAMFASNTILNQIYCYIGNKV